MLGGGTVNQNHRWDFDDGTGGDPKKEEVKKVPPKIQGHTLSKQDLYEKQYGKKSTPMATKEESKKTPKEDEDVDFSKLNDDSK